MVNSSSPYMCKRVDTIHYIYSIPWFRPTDSFDTMTETMRRCHYGIST